MDHGIPLFHQRPVGGASSYLDLSNSDRCLTNGNAGPMLLGVYNNNMKLLDHVAIMNEMVHTVPKGGGRRAEAEAEGW